MTGRDGKYAPTLQPAAAPARATTLTGVASALPLRTHVGLQSEADAGGPSRSFGDEAARAQAAVRQGFLRGHIDVSQCSWADAVLHGEARRLSLEWGQQRRSVGLNQTAGRSPRLDDPARDAVLDATAWIQELSLGEDLREMSKKQCSGPPAEQECVPAP